MKKKILIADDSPTITNILAYLLQEQGYDIAIAEDGVEAIKMVYEVEPDLILLDVEMPKMNGYQVCRLLKNNRETCHIPIIILTSRDHKMDRFWGLSTGADEYVTKDFESTELYLTISEWISKPQPGKFSTGKPKEISERSLLEQVNSLLDKQLFHSTLVNALGALVVNSLSVEQTVKSILNLLDKVCEFVIAAIIWPEKDKGGGLLYLPYNLDEQPVQQMRDLISSDCRKYGFRLEANQLKQIVSEQSKEARRENVQIKSYWSQVLMIRDTVTGILAIGNYHEQVIRPEIEETLQIFCQEASIILDNAILFERLELSKRKLETTIHELRETQAQLVHSEKMASLGQLVAGVAHELNNPITFIYSNIDYLEEYVDALIRIISFFRQAQLTESSRQQAKTLIEELDLEYILKDLDKVIQSFRSGAERTRQIVLDLRNFSRLDRSEIGKLKVEEGIESTLNLLTNKYKHRVQIHRDFAKTPVIQCYAGQLNQVFMNLLSNAADAIEQKGNVWISTRHDHDRVIIQIRDDGCGIRAEVMPRVFDPFYTTKSIGKGTGLGLSISYGIIKKHEGKISISSEVGQGTTFTIELPVKIEEENQ